MSFPPRPPIMPGMIPQGVPMPYAVATSPLMPAVGIPMPPHMLGPSLSVTMSSHTPRHILRPQVATPASGVNSHLPHARPHTYSKRVQEPAGPPVTVFVGNITEKAPDGMIRHILTTCGPVLSWKRVQGASGRLQAFGFCEFGNPDAGLRAIRLLHDWEIGDRKLVVKVDAKTKGILDEYKAEKRKKLKTSGQKSPTQDEKNEDDEDYMDQDMKDADKHSRGKIGLIIKDHELEMKNYVPPPNKPGKEKEKKMSRTQEKLMKLSQGHVDVPASGDPLTSLDDVDMEEGKKDLISREIGKFREIMKRQEEEKEAERRRREVREKERREKEVLRPVRKELSRSRSRSRSREGSYRDRSRSGSPEGSYSNKIRAKTRERRRSLSRSRDRDESTGRERKSEKELQREKEEEEEAKERKKLDRKAREKEAAYQERLRNWETRERKRAKEYEKEKDRERQKQEDESREAKRLKEFLEDYDDERDDPKYYKGRELQRRLSEREKEMEQDGRDRQREKEELDDLRAKILAEGHSDPTGEFERRRAEREELYKPKILIRPDSHMVSKSKKKEPYSASSEIVETQITVEDIRPPSPPSSPHYVSSVKKHQEEEEEEEDDDNHYDNDTQMSMPSAPPSPVTTPAEEVKSVKPVSPVSQQQPSKKKKLDIKEVFSTDDDDSSAAAPKKRKLVPIDYDEDKKSKEEKKEEVAKSQEEKRKHIKSLIDKIPTEKVALFAYSIDWDMVDSQLMEKRIRPWINKKIIEYIGEPEPTLVDFICSKVLVGSAPQSILDDVQMVLDEEAEVFVVKMWRLLIYEIEAKKLGLVK